MQEQYLQVVDKSSLLNVIQTLRALDEWTHSYPGAANQMLMPSFKSERRILLVFRAGDYKPFLEQSISYPEFP
jgi:hypothetical protein